MHQHQNCNHSQPNRHRYKGYWIEVSIEVDFERDHILYTASVERNAWILAQIGVYD